MGANTAISWTDATFNPWMGCSRVSPACRFCYAEALAKRFGLDVWGETKGRRFLSDKYWAKPIVWNRQALAAGRRRRVFCASMADVFDAHPDVVSARERLWALIAETPWLDWLLLTKRPENAKVMVPWGDEWPENVWFGATVESPLYTDRIAHLVANNARYRFVSAEPLLENVILDLTGIALVICGGESGARARPMDPAWARNLRAQCRDADVAFHFKQWGEWRPGLPGDPPKMPRYTARSGESLVRVGKSEAGRELDGVIWDEMPRGWSATTVTTGALSCRDHPAHLDVAHS